jgi:hypothetical protein
MKMGRLILIFAAFADILLCGCNKQYTCECVTTGGATSDFVIAASKQSDAIKKCSSYSSNSNASAPTTCNIK